MALYFLDSSALVKRYVSEPGHAWITTLCDPAQNHDVQIAQIALVEVVAALCRKAREAAITATERDILITDFRNDTVTTYGVRPITTQIYTRAGDLCRTYRLRAYDAVQLAVALALRDDALASGVVAPIFVCADADLLGYAVSEGWASKIQTPICESGVPEPGAGVRVALGAPHPLIARTPIFRGSFFLWQ